MLHTVGTVSIESFEEQMYYLANRKPIIKNTYCIFGLLRLSQNSKHLVQVDGSSCMPLWHAMVPPIQTLATYRDQRG